MVAALDTAMTVGRGMSQCVPCEPCDPCRPGRAGDGGATTGGDDQRQVTMANMNPNIIKFISASASSPARHVGSARAMVAALDTAVTVGRGISQCVPCDPCGPGRAGDGGATTGGGDKRQVAMANMNPNMIKLEYVVRGPLLLRANELEKELLAGSKKPFKIVTKANVGDAHAVGQVPITFIRQVLAAVSHPPLIESAGFPDDVKRKARNVLAACGGGSVGAYSSSYGIEMIRRHAAEFIERRDGVPANWENICLSNGASESIKNVLKTMVKEVDGKPPDPPKQGDPSYDLWLKEKNSVVSSLRERATMVVKSFNEMEGFKCNTVQGAMYAFPQIQLPPKAIEAAKKEGKEPDVYYAFKLLETTGICVIPGTGFNQRPNTWHFRTTILPPPDILRPMLEEFKKFHIKFTAEYS